MDFCLFLGKSAGILVAYDGGMLKLEQVRAEMLDRFERVDRRFAQQEQRLERILQRVVESVEKVDALQSLVVSRQSLVDDPPTVSVPEEWLTTANDPD